MSHEFLSVTFLMEIVKGLDAYYTFSHLTWLTIRVSYVWFELFNWGTNL